MVLGLTASSPWELVRNADSQALSKTTESNLNFRDFPTGPVAKTPHSQAGGLGSIPGQGTSAHTPQLRVHVLQLKIPHAPRPKAAK